jgi:serine/threonine-protein kinase
MGRREWRRWAREQQRLARVGTRDLAVPDEKTTGDLDARVVEERVRRFRRSLVRTLIVVPALFLINLAVQGFPWFIFPSLVLAVEVLGRAGSLWADGVSPRDALRKNWRARIRAAFGVPAPRQAPSLPADPAVGVVPPDVLAGPHGGAVRRAVADREQVRDILAKLSPIEKEMLPDVTPTVNGLVERVASVAVTVHRLDADVSGVSLATLDERIAGLQRDSMPDTDRRLTLLQRQRATLHDLLERRQTLLSQLESASLALQNLKLDLLKLRSAGVGSSLEDVTSATREARALSRDIGHLLDAASDVRKI